MAGPSDPSSPNRSAPRLMSWSCPASARGENSPQVGVVQLPGSHNFPFTHPEELARLVVRWAGEGRPPELRGPLQRQSARPVRALVARATGRLACLAGRSGPPIDLSG